MSSIKTLITYFGIGFLFSHCESGSQESSAVKNTPEIPLEYLGSESCKSCHTKEYKDWTLSDHYKAMQKANEQTVLGDFNNSVFNSDGIHSSFFKRKDKFFINTQGEDGKNREFQVEFVFGHFPLQQYLISFPGGRLQASRLSWDVRNKKWFHQYAGQKIKPDDWLHWTGGAQNWNTMCAACHSTNLKKNYNYEKDTYSTTYSEINVACESCHGAGSRHISYIRSEDYKNGKKTFRSGLNYGKDSLSRLQVNTCAPCHARKTEISENFIPSDEALNNWIPEDINHENYFADGQINQEDYEYASFTQSKMFHKNVRCSNCHNAHSGKLLKEGNDLCLSCHAPKYTTQEHHFHKEGSESAKCVNCHMTSKTYMGIDLRRDHSFRIPRPDQSEIYKTPNACNSCHTAKSAKWAATAIEKWYGPVRQNHFSDDLLPGSLLNKDSESHLVKLLNDTLQPVIARATAAGYLGELTGKDCANALMFALRDKEALIRYMALRSLENYTSEWWRYEALKLLKDPVRAVRIAAASLFHRLNPSELQSDYRSAYLAADNENLNYLRYQSDFALGNVMLADYYLQGGDYRNAVSNYLRGLKKDNQMNYARLNLSAAYSALGNSQDALKTLNEAMDKDPKNDRIFYNLGLLYYEMQDTLLALKNFKQAQSLGSTNPALYYNYGLLLIQQKRPKEAEQVLLKGFELNPGAGNINYALAYLFTDQKQVEKARKHAVLLKQIDPKNPQYQPMFKAFGM